MKEFIYPAIIYKGDDKENPFVIYIPDLEVSTNATSYEEAFAFGQRIMEYYFKLALKNDLEYNLPSAFEDIQKKYPSMNVFLVDAIVDTKKL